MKKLVVILAVMLVASSAMAIIDETPDALGFYFDAEADVVDAVDYSMFMDAYVVITNPTFTSFKAVEMSLQAMAGDVALGSNGVFGTVPAEYGDNVMLGGLPNIVYSTSAPVAVSGNMFKVLTITFTRSAMGLDPRYETGLVDFFINPAPNASLPGACIVLPAQGADFVQLVPVAPYGMPVAKMNGAGVVAVEEASFGAVKSLYR